MPLESDIDKWAKVVKASGARIDRAAPRLRVSFALLPNLAANVAKIRAASQSPLTKVQDFRRASASAAP